MTQRRTKTIVPYTADEMFALVADVEKYPQFVPHCTALRIVKFDVADGSGQIVADMVVSYSAFREKFRSHVTLGRQAHRIEVAYAEGPFRKLHNLWLFRDVEGGSEIDFTIDFEFRNFFLQAAASTVFERAFVKMSEAFVERAKEVYGDRRAIPLP